MDKQQKIPWENEVDDDDRCQVVKEKKMGGDLVKCKGACSKGDNCVLQKKKARSKQPWQDVSDSLEVFDKAYEYRCICR